MTEKNLVNNHIADHIKAVFFDHDDTLVNTIGSKWAQHKYVAKRYYGIDLTDEDIAKHWGKPLKELVSLFYGTDDAEEALANTVRHHEEYPKPIFTETIPVLKHLHQSGILTGIITATSRFSFEHDLELHKVPRDYINYTQTADDTDYHKPDPKVFEPAIKWLKKLNIKPSEVMYVGDGLHDMKAALGAGFSFLGVETGLVTAEEFAQNNASSIPNVGHLLKS